jgi:hypothetical protein
LHPETTHVDERPSFRRRRDVWRLVGALAVPSILMITAYLAPLLAREVSRAGHRDTWISATTLVWFYGFGFPAWISLGAFFFLGIFRLAWWREYRQSRYGWAWLVLTYLNLGVLSTVVTSPAVQGM